MNFISNTTIIIYDYKICINCVEKASNKLFLSKSFIFQFFLKLLYLFLFLTTSFFPFILEIAPGIKSGTIDTAQAQNGCFHRIQHCRPWSPV